MTRYRVASINEIPEDSGLAVEVEGVSIGLFRTGHTVRAIGDACPHMGASLCDGYLDGENVVCPWHGWVFSLETGANVFDEEEPVPVFRVIVAGDTVFIEMDAAQCAAVKESDPPRESNAR